MLPFFTSKQTSTSFSSAVVLRALRGYKLIISPLFSGSCRYYPSCSDYMSEAVRTHGTTRGVWLGLRRLGRCHPFGGHGVDPVPQPSASIGARR